MLVVKDRFFLLATASSWVGQKGEKCRVASLKKVACSRWEYAKFLVTSVNEPSFLFSSCSVPGFSKNYANNYGFRGRMKTGNNILFYRHFAILSLKSWFRCLIWYHPDELGFCHQIELLLQLGEVDFDLKVHVLVDVGLTAWRIFHKSFFLHTVGVNKRLKVKLKQDNGITD